MGLLNKEFGLALLAGLSCVFGFAPFGFFPIPALAGYAQTRITVAGRLRIVLVMPAAWVLFEWLRGTLFTGFPWLTQGYAHSDSPLAGYAPLVGGDGGARGGAGSAGGV